MIGEGSKVLVPISADRFITLSLFRLELVFAAGRIEFGEVGCKIIAILMILRADNLRHAEYAFVGMEQLINWESIDVRWDGESEC